MKDQNELETLVQGMEHEETQRNKRVVSRKTINNEKGNAEDGRIERPGQKTALPMSM